MSGTSWINLDQSFSKSFRQRQRENERTKRIRRDIASNKNVDIEDDNSQENFPDNSNLTSVSPKRRKITSLGNITNHPQQDSSEESVEYNPDDTQPPPTEVKTKIKPTIPLSSSTRIIRPFSTINPASSSGWKTIEKSFTENTNLTDSILDSSDSDESSPLTSLPLDTMIDECSTDSSQIPSLVVQESIIEAQDSLTPPAEPFQMNIPNKLRKKRKVPCVKGGMVERLTKCLSKSKSNLLFWQHHRSAELVSPGTIICIDRVEKTYGRTLIHTTVNNTPTIFCVDPEAPQLQKDDIVEVEFDRGRSCKTDTHNLYPYVNQVLHVK